MDWLPLEISVVGTPADITIGVGRSKDETNEIEVPDNFRELEKKEVILEDKKEQEEISDNSHAKAKLDLLKLRANSIK